MELLTNIGAKVWFKDNETQRQAYANLYRLYKGQLWKQDAT